MAKIVLFLEKNNDIKKMGCKSLLIDFSSPNNAQSCLRSGATKPGPLHFLYFVLSSRRFYGKKITFILI